MENKDIYIELLDRFLLGETSLEEEKILAEWFERISPDVDLYQYYQNYWDQTKNAELPAETQGKMFYRIKSQINPITNKKKEKSKKYFLWSNIAAAIFLFLSFNFVIYNQRQIKQLSSRTNVFFAEKGQRSNMILPDGTKIWLNSDTEIRYAGDYGKKDRRILLSGEAYFDVAQDKDHRFIVQVGEMEVECLGTEFNIKAYKEDQEITTSLVEGKVKTRWGTKSTTLQPDQSLYYNKQTHKSKITKGDVKYNQMWRQNELVFNGETLADVAVMMKRLYNINVEFKTEEIKHYRFSGVIKNNSLQNVFELISLTSPIEYERKDSIIFLSKKKKFK